MRQWCPACGAEMMEKPLFTSMYYECPKCDSKPEPKAVDPTMLLDPISSEVKDKVLDELRNAIAAMYGADPSKVGPGKKPQRS